MPDFAVALIATCDISFEPTGCVLEHVNMVRMLTRLPDESNRHPLCIVIVPRHNYTHAEALMGAYRSRTRSTCLRRWRAMSCRRMWSRGPRL
jgi:hypothetical protein